MSFIFMNRRIVISGKHLLFGFGALVAWLTLVYSEFHPVVAIFIVGAIYLILRFTTKPFSRAIARLGYSISWKFELGIVVIAVLFLIVSVIQIRAMTFMHGELHEIQTLAEHGERGQARAVIAINSLEDTHHGAFYRLLPFLGVLGVLGAAGVGGAMAWSVIDPVRRMERAMGRMASGDFSQPVEVENRDELGDLAGRLNDMALDLARLQEATLAEERAHALRERIIQVTTAQEEERRRISRDLHDGLGPSLASIGNRIRACQLMVDSDPQRAKMELEEVAKGMKGHVQEVRQLIHDLRPLALDQMGLAGAVEQHVARFSQEAGISASFGKSGDATLNPFAEVTVFRTVQECLTNVQKHANASQVEVRLQTLDSDLKATVKDNGRGFGPHGVSSGSGGIGMGLLSMRERAELLGGSLSVESVPGGGCEVVLFIPLTEVAVGAYPSASG